MPRSDGTPAKRTQIDWRAWLALAWAAWFGVAYGRMTVERRGPKLRAAVSAVAGRPDHARTVR